MYSLGSFGSRYQPKARMVLELIEELKCAEAASYLFSVHKDNVSEWVDLRDELLRQASNHRQLSFVATLLTVSTASTLSESSLLIPGLNAIKSNGNDF